MYFSDTSGVTGCDDHDHLSLYDDNLILCATSVSLWFMGLTP